MAIKDSTKFLQKETERLSANIRSKRTPFTDDDSRKLVDLVQSMGKTARLINQLESKWGKDVLKFVQDYFAELRKEKV